VELQQRREKRLDEHDKLSRFEQSILPHMNAAHNLARWLTRNDDDAQDVVQEAYLRAFKFFGGFRGGDSRAWLLKIVRNTCYTWLQKNRRRELMTEFDEERHSTETDDSTPYAILLQNADGELVRRALEELPAKFREMLIMRELEGLSYKEIADIADVPMGTVMSRLARGRTQLQNSVADLIKKET
jgi:RNA polymerase sigma factor (sigma-70 family)